VVSVLNSGACGSSTATSSETYCEAVDPSNHRICYCMQGTSEATQSSTSSTNNNNNNNNGGGPPNNGGPTHSSTKSSASSFPTVGVAVGASVGSVAIFGLFIAYGLWRRQQFADTNKMTSDVSMQPMQVARPVMPDGRI